MSQEIEKIKLENIKHVFVIASGKGGVGKSTVAANLAISLARNGMRVALVDADIYGPSIPRMFGIEDEKPGVTVVGGKELMQPILKFGVKIMSIGFFVTRSQSLIWRGPMASNAITQLLDNTEWGDIDVMLIDLPPGTGDILITAVQKLKIDGAIIVTTPQEIALNDARKATSMFINENIQVPLVGVIENMSWFTPEKHPDEKYYVFGKGGGEKLAGEFKVPVLGQIPLVLEVGQAAEKGLSVYNQNNKTVIEVFDNLAGALINAV
ncbi:MAG TPA: Mrp/NBP35 family ATP-binding protein [Bacteroidales bacterium]|nr:Mrp/NBP35 family ATP-binding protein [Bacteroidales bacterium]HPR57479.1 Mrp/NBP35 family ATP-binding protein [Bacteroidales bacterium]HRW96510.1 Mrp/NBP35 family ATP-binding protein [Bacteroidales bacterium]